MSGAVQVGAFFTTTRWSLVSILIRRITGGAWSHAGIVVGDSYFEAHAFGADRGFRGPKCLAKLKAWGGRRGNRLEIVLLPMAEALDQQRLRAWCEDEVLRARRGYDVGQIARLWAWHRCLRWIGFDLAPDPSKVICSEAVTLGLRVLGLDLCDSDHRTPDSVDPSSAHRRLREIISTIV